MMTPLAFFGIESHTFNLVVDLLIVCAAVIYMSLIYWTYADARRRIVDPMLIACATGASMFPFVGTLVYIILRPPEYLEDVQERELEMQAAQARLHQLDHGLCPHCDYPIERDFIRCPSCLRKLKERCGSCSKPLDKAWTICPYCETDVPPDATPRRRTRRRGSAADSGAAERALAESEELTVATFEERAVAAYEDGRTAGAAPEPASRSRPSGRRPRPSTGTEDLI
jgi:Double zinc ribbon